MALNLEVLTHSFHTLLQTIQCVPKTAFLFSYQAGIFENTVAGSAMWVNFIAFQGCSFILHHQCFGKISDNVFIFVCLVIWCDKWQSSPLLKV